MVEDYQVRGVEILASRKPGLAPYLYRQYGRQMVRHYESRSRRTPLTRREQYHYEQAKISVELKDVTRSIRYVKGLAPEEHVRFLGDPQPVRKEIAISRLEESKESLTGVQSELIGYHKKGYTITRKPGGGYLVYKQVTTTHKMGSDEDKTIREAKKSYQSGPWYEQGARAFFTGVTQFPKLFYHVGGEIIGDALKPKQPGTGIPLFPDISSSVTKGLSSFQKDIITTEHKGWKQLKSGDKGGWIWEHVIKSPTVSDIVIPAAIGFGVAPAMGYITKAGVSISSTATSVGSKILGKSMQVYPYVVGGIGLGMGAGTVTGTYALEQEGLVKPGETRRSALKFGTQLSFAYMGYRGARRITGGKQITGREYKYKSGTIRQEIGLQRRITVMGKSIPVGKFKPVVSRTFIKPDIKSYTGIPKQPSSNIIVTPSKTGILSKVSSYENFSKLTGGYKIYTGSGSLKQLSGGDKTNIPTIGKQLSLAKDTGIPWYQEKPWYAPSKTTVLKPVKELYPDYKDSDIGTKLLPKKQVSIKSKRILSVDTKPEINILKWTNIYTRSKVSIAALTKTKTLTEPLKWTDIYTKTRTSFLTSTKTDTKTSVFPMIGVVVLPSVKTKTRTSFLTKTRTKTLVMPSTKTLTMPLTETETLTMPLTKTLTMPLTETETLTMPSTETQTLIKTPIPIILTGEIPVKKDTGVDSYHVYVKHRQYKEGAKVGTGELKQVTRKPLRLEEAKSYGASIVSSSEKATFILKRTTEKPGKLPGGVDPWFKIGGEYYEKEPGVFIEKTRYRINTPGEIRNISALGWSAPKKRKRKTSWGL